MCSRFYWTMPSTKSCLNYWDIKLLATAAALAHSISKLSHFLTSSSCFFVNVTGVEVSGTVRLRFAFSPVVSYASGEFLDVPEDSDAAAEAADSHSPSDAAVTFTALIAAIKSKMPTDRHL